MFNCNFCFFPYELKKIKTATNTQQNEPREI